MKEEPLLLLSDLQKLINQVVLIDYTIIILGGVKMEYILKAEGICRTYHTGTVEVHALKNATLILRKVNLPQ